MTIQTRFYNWQQSDLDWTSAPFETCSPNLTELRHGLERRWPGWVFLGCHSNRTIRSGTVPSSHAYGSAVDINWGQGTAAGYVGQVVLEAEVLPWLIDNSAELGIDAIHHYVRGDIWRPPGTSGRPADSDGWKHSTSTSGGMNQSWAQWIHVETHLDSWGWTTPIEDRLTGEDNMVPVDPPARWVNGITLNPHVVHTVAAPFGAKELAGHMTVSATAPGYVVFWSGNGEPGTADVQVGPTGSLPLPVVYTSAPAGGDGFFRFKYVTDTPNGSATVWFDLKRWRL